MSDENLNSNPPDPAETLFSDEHIPKQTALEEWCRKIDALHWCVAGKGNDHSDCDPLETLEEALNLMILLKLSIKDIRQVRGGR